MRISDWSSDVCSSDLRVVVLADQGDEPAIVNVALGLGERAAFLQGFEHVVEPGKGQVLMAFKHPLAQRVERFGLVTDIALERFGDVRGEREGIRSEEHTSELQSLMRTSYAVFCLKKKKN